MASVPDKGKIKGARFLESCSNSHEHVLFAWFGTETYKWIHLFEVNK